MLEDVHFYQKRSSRFCNLNRQTLVRCLPECLLLPDDLMVGVGGGHSGGAHVVRAAPHLHLPRSVLLHTLRWGHGVSSGIRILYHSYDQTFVESCQSAIVPLIQPPILHNIF